MKPVPVPSGLPYTPILEQLPPLVPFVGPEALERERGEPFRARLGANESAFGISPAARRAGMAALERMSWYADPENHELRAALAAEHGVAPDNIAVAAGIDDLLGLAVRAFAAERAAVMTAGSYPTFAFHVAGYGARLIEVPYREDHVDLERLPDAAAAGGAPLLYAANPDNPAGTWRAAADVERVIERLPPGMILLLDEAYAEFAPPEAIPAAGVLAPNVLRLRTFSKAHGMAGGRVGYAICAAEVWQAFEKIRHHYGMNRIAQEAALASLGDHGFIAGVAAAVRTGRDEYARIAARHGLTVLPSGANFVNFDAGSTARAEALLRALIRRGVFVRKAKAPPLDRTVRVTVGRPDERAVLAEVLGAALADADREAP